MLSDGFNLTVTIIPMVHNTSNRTTKDQAKADTTQQIENVPCRIIKDEKALFLPDVAIKIGDIISDTASGKQYYIRKINPINGLTAAHHISCEIEQKKV